MSVQTHHAAVVARKNADIGAVAMAEFIAATGATDTTDTRALVDYLVAQNLWDSARFYPLKSAQNHGSGATVRGLGGLTSNNMTLYNSPVWGSGGIAFTASSSHVGAIGDFLATETLTVFVRRSGAMTATGTVWGQWLATGDKRSLIISESYNTADAILMGRSSDGTSGSTKLDFYESASSTFPTADTSIVSQWISGGGRSLWLDKTSTGVSLIAGRTEQTDKYNAGVTVTIAGSGDTGSFSGYADGTYIALCHVIGTLTTGQREAITDYINAL